MHVSKTRYLCSQLVQITDLDGPQRLNEGGNLEEIGEHFAEVLTEHGFRLNTRIRISCEAYQMEGTVESCSLSRPLGYFVRVKLATPSWSEQQFMPQHLLQINDPTPQVNHLGAASGY